MKDQLSLFDLPPVVVNRQPLSRADDQWTSHAAAKAYSSGKWMKDKFRVLVALVKHGPATTAELAAATGMDRYVVARRMPDLHDNGDEPDLVRPLGEPVRCRATGNWAQRWAATAVGLQLAVRLQVAD